MNCVSVCGSERLLIDFCEQVATRTAKQVSDVAYKEPENATETVKWVSERRRGTTVQVGEMSWWTRARELLCCCDKNHLRFVLRFTAWSPEPLARRNVVVEACVKVACCEDVETRDDSRCGWERRVGSGCFVEKVLVVCCDQLAPRTATHRSLVTSTEEDFATTTAKSTTD